MSITPPETEYGFSYEYGLDVMLDGEEWQTVRFLSDFDPQVTSITQPGQTYDDKGAPHDIKTSESWVLTGNIQQHHLPTGELLPEMQELKALTEPTARGNAANGTFRWYDNPATRAANPDEAYQGRGTVQLTRAATGADGAIGGWNFTVTGQGPRTKIAHPVDGAGA